MFKKLSLIFMLAFVMLASVTKAQTLPSSGTWNATTITSNTTVSLTNTVTLNGGILIESGVTLTITNQQGHNIRIHRGTSSYTGRFFVLKDGAKLVITGAEGSYVVLDGGAVWSTQFDARTTNSGVVSSGQFVDITKGSVDFNWVIMQNLDATYGTNTYNGVGIRFYGGSVGDYDDYSLYAHNVLNHVIFRGLKNEVHGGGGGSAIFLSKYYLGELSITNCQVSGCYCKDGNSDQGGTIRSNGACRCVVTIDRTLIANNLSTKCGGGIYWNAAGTPYQLPDGTYQSATMTVSNSTIRGNQADWGGGMYTTANAMILSGNNVIENNTANYYGGGLMFDVYPMIGNGGYQQVHDFSVNLTSGNKIRNNHSKGEGGGIYVRVRDIFHDPEPFTLHYDFDFNGAEVTNNTSESNGGGIAIYDFTTTQYTTLACNMNFRTGLVDGNSAVQNGGGIYINNGMPVNVTGVTISNNHAGASLSGSKTEYNGGGMYLGEGCNIDFQSGTMTQNDATGNGGGFYVAGASTTVSVSSGAKITKNNAKVGGGFYVSGGSLTVSGSTTEISENTSTAHAAGFYSLSGVTVDAAKVKKNVAGTNGGGFYCAGGSTLIKNGAVVDENTANNGAGIYVAGGTLTVQDAATKIQNNKSKYNGGGVHLTGGHAFINDGPSIYNNKALASNGGAFYISGGNITISGASQITYNTAEQNGGMLYSVGGTVLVEDGAVIDHNSAKLNGGAIYSEAGVTINSTTLTNNDAIGDGGAFYVEAGTTNVGDGSDISYNTATNGGGVYVTGNLNLDASSITYNTASGMGGGVYSTGGATILTGFPTVDYNTAGYGGGIYVAASGSITMGTITDADGGSVSNNIAHYDGGALYTLGDFTINGGTLDSNEAATNNGGAVYAGAGIIAINDGIITNNVAHNDGGGIYTKGELDMDAGGIYDNNATRGGGLFVDAPDDSSCPGATLTNGGIYSNIAIDGGGVFINKGATLNLFKEGYINNNLCGDAESGMGGGVYQRGTFNVAGTAVSVSGNFKINPTNPSAEPIMNNVYLVSEHEGNNDYYTTITIVNWTDPKDPDPTTNYYSGVPVIAGSTVDIGITIDEVPHAVIHSETPDDPGHLYPLYLALHDQDPNALLKDDLGKYQAVYANEPLPYNHKDIFFTATWQKFSFPEGVTEFNDSDREDDHDQYFGNINTEQKLAEFMCYVNGLNGYSAHPSQDGQVTSDLYMSQYLWLPIGVEDGNNPYPSGLPYPYSGHFDGGGHIINGLKSIGLMGLSYYGLFGKVEDATISNTFVTEANFASSANDTLGLIVGKMVRGKLYYSEGGGRMTSSGSSVMGGLVGYARDVEIHSCMAMPAMTCNGDNAIMGGLVGKLYATQGSKTTSTYCTLYNCFANPQFTTTSELALGGGFVGLEAKYNNDYSHTRVSECYVRLDREHSIPANNRIGKVVGDMEWHALNTVMINVYMPTPDYCGAPGYSKITNLKGVNEHGSVENMAFYEPVSDPGTYYYDPEQDTRIVDVPTGHQIPDPDNMTLLPQLQKQAQARNWVTDPEDRPNPPVCYWKRTGASAYMASGGTINGDYPILNFDSVSPICGKTYAPRYIALGSKDGITIDYCVSLSDMLKRYNNYDGGGDINLFHSVDNSTGTYKATDQDVRIYFDEGVTILQGEGGYLNAVSYQTLHHSTDYWHTFSTVMGPRDYAGVTKGQSLIGFNYGITGQVNFSQDEIGPNPAPGETGHDPWFNNPCHVTLDAGPDPSNPNDNNSIFPYASPMDSIDLYTFFEDQYHWVNLKRNSNSHWHMDDHSSKITYTNEEYLIPGKGYLMALAPEKRIYEFGVLNCGTVYTSDRDEDKITHNSIDNPYHGGYGYQGYNLLGNPYQAYLDFEAFASQNSSLWSGEHSLDYTAFVYDSDYDLYLGIKANVTGSKGSAFPSKWLAPHQGFFIVKTNVASDAPTQARFVETGTNGMCSLTGDGGLLRGETPEYPLINLFVRDEQGHGDVTSIEFGRPSLEGVGKQKALRSGDAIVYTRYANEDYAMLLLDEDVESLPVHFDCAEGGVYTLTWNTANAQFTQLTLVDNLTGVSTDCLSHDSYSFEGTPSDFTSRFKLVFSYNDEEENNEDANVNFAFFSNGDLIVNGEGYMEIMDVNGRVLSCTRLTDTQNRVSMPNVAAGIYVIRLNEKTQKIVVR